MNEVSYVDVRTHWSNGEDWTPPKAGSSYYNENRRRERMGSGEIASSSALLAFPLFRCACWD